MMGNSRHTTCVPNLFILSHNECGDEYRDECGANVGTNVGTVSQ